MPTMQSFGYVIRAAGLSLCLILGTGAVWAHGASGGMHAGFAIPAPLAAPIAPMASSSARVPTAARTTTSTTHGTSAGAAPALPQPTAPTPLPSSVVQGCEGAVQVNCLAKAKSTLGASGGDTTPVWSAPIPTTLPPAPTSDPITEPAQDTSLPPEQSGGASGVVITAGGGPTLTDCMVLWEPAVHMSKSDWKAVCIRTMNGIEEPSLAIRSVDPSAPAHAAGKSASASHG
ncbi:MAG: hypothetical protein AB7S70_07970 [Hyphomicrobium sp.]|uniref:hypothetical protein n=1 Tax=Hyphomicrobium sp. TaxID=82 RepID=UPI003D121BEC